MPTSDAMEAVVELYAEMGRPLPASISVSVPNGWSGRTYW